MDSGLRPLSKFKAINSANVTYIEREQGNSFQVHFVGTDQPLILNGGTDEGKALLKWWEQTTPFGADGVSNIPSL